MPYLNRAALFKKLEDLGETAPQHWTRLQLEGRIWELEQEAIPAAITERKLQMAALQKATKNKGTLVKFMTENLHISVTGSETMKILQAKAYTRKTTSPATAMDFLEFGKHSDQTYGTMLEKNQNYTQWRIKTMMENNTENESNWRLIRFAKWAQDQMKGGYQQPPTPPRKQPPKQRSPGDASSSDFSLVSKTPETAKEPAQLSVPDSEDEMLSETECTVQELEAKIRSLQRRQKDKKHKGNSHDKEEQ